MDWKHIRVSSEHKKIIWMDPQQHIFGFVTNLYNYILVQKDICD